MNTSTEIRFLKGVGEKRAVMLAKLGVFTVGDLLRLYPTRYEDWNNIKKISEAAIGETCCVSAIVDRKPIPKRLPGDRTMYKAEVTDGESILTVTIFNSKFAADKLVEGEELLFFGRMGGILYHKEMTNPEIAKPSAGGRLHAIYPLTQGLSSSVISKLVAAVLEEVGDSMSDPLPTGLREKYCLCTLSDALRHIHQPTDEDLLSEARRRLIFEELFTLQLGLLRMRGRRLEYAGCVLERDYMDEYLRLLPFTMTGAQSRAVAAAMADMRSTTPMNRLLQGDVGSGKTAVAAALIYSTAKNGFQSALMAPTEILARQHFNTLTKLFEGTGLTVALLTGSTPAREKRKIKAALADGSIYLIVGTHAIIQSDVDFRSLALVVTDEQHRFGVEQRKSLGAKGNSPHILVMSATPIPRTLALIIYGDLDVTVLDELPPGRTPVETFAVGSDKRTRALNYVKRHVEQGRQGYIVCPMIEESDSVTELAAATEYYEKLSGGLFRGIPMELLHGRMKPAEKERVMEEFVSGRCKVLVSTTVIEVGVDVPNAVIMVIENAERFGLSQLHQLRGRVGRGSARSTCILISDAQNDEAASRLKTMTQTNDGFKIAEADLQMRGPGDFFGARQHGLPELRIADMVKDGELLSEAASAAKRLYDADPTLSAERYAPLRARVESLVNNMVAN